MSPPSPARAALPWGTALSSWTDPAPASAPPFTWEGESWRLTFDFLDSEDEEALRARVLAEDPADPETLTRQLRLAWSLHAWNGHPFVATVVQRALADGTLRPEDTSDGAAVRTACETFLRRVKGPLLLAMAAAYQQAAESSLGILREMEADPFFAVAPVTPGPSSDPASPPDASPPPPSPSSPTTPPLMSASVMS